MRAVWTDDDERAFHRYAWCVLAGWVEMIAPARTEQVPLLTPRAPVVRTRRALRPWRIFAVSVGVLVVLWILV